MTLLTVMFLKMYYQALNGIQVVCGGINYQIMMVRLKKWNLREYPGTFKYGWHPHTHLFSHP